MKLTQCHSMCVCSVCMCVCVCVCVIIVLYDSARLLVCDNISNLNPEQYIVFNVTCWFFFCLPSIQNILLVSNPFTSDVICSVVVILWHNVAEITYKYIAKLYEMHFLFLMILEYFCWFNRKPVFWIPSCHFINPLSPELNPICYLLALLAHDFLHDSRIRVKYQTLKKKVLMVPI
jgi:hypothetical protein